VKLRVNLVLCDILSPLLWSLVAGRWSLFENFNMLVLQLPLFIIIAGIARD